MLSLTVFLQETVMKYLTKHVEKSEPLGTTGKILSEKEDKPILDVSHSTCAENVDYYAKGDFCTDIGPVKAEEPDFDNAEILNEEPDDFYVKEKVYDPSDIRMVFTEAIDDFYNYSEDGGPSFYEEKLVLLMEGYLKKNRRLTSWTEKLNRLEIRKYVFSNIAKLSTPPVKKKGDDPASMENSSSELMLLLKSESLYEKEISSRLAELTIQHPPVHHSAMKNINSKNKEKKKFRGVRKFFSSLFCRRKKYHKD